MKVSPRQLRMFLALSESLNFSKAAETLLMTQPSLSKAIQELESTLGLPLFERTTRSVRLTPGGRRMASIARGILGEYEAGLQRLQSSSQHEALQLSVASWPSLAHVVLPEVCSEIEQSFPGAQISVHDYANSMCIQKVLDHQVDFALASVAPSHPELDYRELLRDRFVLLSCGRWRKRVPPRLRLDDLLDLPLITLTDASTAMRYMNAAYLQRGIEYRPKMQVDQATTVAGLVKKEVGVAIMPYLGILPILETRGMQISEVVDGPLRSLGVVTRRNGNPSTLALAAIRQTERVCLALIQKQPGFILEPSLRK